MADSKKYDGNTWEHSLRKLTTATDTLVTLPADLYADGTNATVGLVGNMQQTGTPTPSSPIYPTECGDLETTGEHAGQYKIPISSANTTTPVYLGQVQSTRQIKKLVLTGQETGWNRSSSGGRSIFYLDTITPDYLRSNDITLLCSHYKAIAGVTGAGDVGEGETSLFKTVGVTQRLYFGDNNYSVVDDFKTYLAQQYANGTPVTVWYVLASETTGIVNESLRKIGTYADTVSGITIPTITGADSFDVLTTLKPSEVSLAYTGWHDATVKEKSRNLFDENYSDISGTIQYSPLYVGEGSFTLSTTTPYDSSVANVFLLSGNVSTGASTAGNGAWLNHNATTQSVDGYVTIAYRHYTGTTSPVDCQTMLNTGETALPYEPYWK